MKMSVVVVVLVVDVVVLAVVDVDVVHVVVFKWSTLSLDSPQYPTNDRERTPTCSKRQHFASIRIIFTRTDVEFMIE